MTLNDRSSSGVLVCAISEPSAIKGKMVRVSGMEISREMELGGSTVWGKQINRYTF